MCFIIFNNLCTTKLVGNPESTVVDTTQAKIRLKFNKIYFYDERIFECLNINKTYRIEKNKFPPIDQEITCITLPDKFDSYNKIGMYYFVRSDEDGNRVIGIIDLNMIEKIVYSDGRVVTGEEIISSNRKWKYGVGMGIIGILATLVMVSS